MTEILSLRRILTAFTIALLLGVGSTTLCTSCSNPLTEEEDFTSGTPVTFSIHSFEMQPFSERNARNTDQKQVSRIDLGIFDEQGNKVQKVNQVSTDEDFARPVIKLAPGSYQMVVVAHCGSGMGTITSPSQVTFPNNKVTDTFAKVVKFTVGEQPKSVDITLARVVAMVRFIFTDESIPDELEQVKFYYTGASSTLNPSTGFGSKKSRQSQIIKIKDAQKDKDGNTVFEVYTFPHDISGELSMTVTPMDQKEQAITSEITLTLPIKLNHITECHGELMEGSSTFLNNAVAINIADKWEGKLKVSF